MFFLRFAKNKRFKNRYNLSGQIMPFLLVIIAIFLGAFISTVNIGQVAINNTCNDNAADACALAAASNMAFILNALHKDQGDYKAQFDEFQNELKALTKIEEPRLAAAKDELTQALPLINSAISEGGAGEICTVWQPNGMAVMHLTQASLLFSEAAVNIGLAEIIALGKKDYVKTFKDFNEQNYCMQLDVLNDKYNKAKSDGVKYALQNNCVYPNLSADQQNGIMKMVEEQETQDDMEQNQAEQNQPDPPYSTVIPNPWEDTPLPPQRNMSYPPLSPIQNIRDTEYAWQDDAGNDHSMGANVHLPKIDTFKLEVTSMNEPCGPKEFLVAGDHFGNENLHKLSKFIVNNIPVLLDFIAKEAAIYAQTVHSADNCSAVGTCCPWDYWGLDTKAETVVYNLTNLARDLSNGSPSDMLEVLNSLIEQNEKIPKDMAPPDGGKRVISSKGCSDAVDVIVLGINDVKFESGCVSCNGNMSHAGGSSSGTSMSSFGGGTLNADQPNQHYIPGLVNGENGCPSDTGLTTGTTTPEVLSDESPGPYPVTYSDHESKSCTY